MARPTVGPNPGASRALVVAASLLFSLLAASPARALVVPAFFTGCTTIDRFTQIFDYRANVPFAYYGEQTRLDIDVDHGVVDDGGLTSNIPPGQWEFDFDMWAPLVGKYDIQAGGVVTYGSPANNVFAVTWVDVPSRTDGVRNTFQVVFFGDSSYHTNTGLTIAAGSVVFAYGSPTDPHGTVHYSTANGAAIGMNEHGTIRTLDSLGIGDSLGVLSDLDIPTLQNSGDPFLFVGGGTSADTPAPFESVPELGGNTGVTYVKAGRVSLAASPSPVREATTLSYALEREGPVRLEICDVQGRRVATLADGIESAGPHAATWNARASDGARVVPGVYLARLEAAGVRRMTRIVVLH
jgi:hypothetical protein